MLKIVIIGAGSIWSMVDAFLQRADIQVTLFGWHEQVNALRKHGLINDYSNGEIIQLGLSHGMRKSYNSSFVDMMYLVR